MQKPKYKNLTKSTVNKINSLIDVVNIFKMSSQLELLKKILFKD